MQEPKPLHNRIDLTQIPFSDRGSRLLLGRRGDALTISLAERWVKQEEEVGNYRIRRPFIDDFSFMTVEGEPLPFIVDSDPYAVELRSERGIFRWMFLDAESLLVELPVGSYGFRFAVRAESAQTDRRGGVLRGIRNAAYTTNARLIENTAAQGDDGYITVRVMLEVSANNVLLINVTPRPGFIRTLPPAESVLEAAKARWHDWFAAAPPVLDAYRPQYDFAWWVMASGLLSPRHFITREAMSPSKQHYVGAWLWDQFFHAIAYRHVDTELAENQLRLFIDHQQPNGMFPDAIHDEGTVTHLTTPVDADVTKPPLMAWAALKLYETSGHLDFLHEIYEPLKRWNAWWVRENTDAHGLFVYRHPFSSGLDDNPLFDYGMPVTSPDLNTYMCIQFESLARIAKTIGADGDVPEYERQRKELAARMIEFMWDEEKGVFNALNGEDVIPVLTPFHLLPLWISGLPDAIVTRMVETLTDPQHFGSTWRLPTVALDDPHFDPQTMWRGPVWALPNYLFVEALNGIGRHDLARELRRNTLELLMLHPDIYEYYHPLTGGRPPKSAPSFGWSAAIFIDFALQESAESAEQT